MPAGGEEAHVLLLLLSHESCSGVTGMKRFSFAIKDWTIVIGGEVDGVPTMFFLYPVLGHNEKP